MAELTTAQKLAQAEEALHLLEIGKKMVNVSYGDTRVQYTQADKESLRRYIATLKGETDPDSRRRPLGVCW